MIIFISGIILLFKFIMYQPYSSMFFSRLQLAFVTLILFANLLYFICDITSNSFMAGIELFVVITPLICVISIKTEWIEHKFDLNHSSLHVASDINVPIEAIQTLFQLLNTKSKLMYNNRHAIYSYN